MLDQSISVIAPVADDPRLLTTYKESSSLVGINAQKHELANWAMDKEQQLKVMAIVGFGGLGKTTLANEVYREVGGKFDCKAFVSVSQKPEIIGPFNSLLSQLGLCPYSHACQVQDLINNIREHLQDKRYYIIVDDLWDIRAWYTIQCAFPENNHRSRVMITTRNEDLARLCCGNHRCIHNMKPLSEQDSRKLFFDRIFGSEDACPSELRKASCEILKKCGGLPLAIITMASTLACQQTRSEAQRDYILKSLSTKFATNSNYEDMMYILDLSYKNLPRHLKACFLYLGSYPEDHVINRVELVRRWVAEGFVSNSGGEDIWDVAESYFSELLNRSMIQPTYEGNISGVVSRCRVHDMLLELIVTRCKEDNFLSLLNDPRAMMVEVRDKAIRRLNVVGSRGTKDDKVVATTAVNLGHIRSLSILGQSNWMPSLLECKFLRVLSLQFSYETHMEIDLTVINQLSQLRYLAVSGDGERIMLPSQIRGLQLLETLDLSGICRCGTSFEIVDAPRLSHLAVPWDMRLPAWIGKVKSLRNLSWFNLPLDSLEGIIGLGELTALSVLNLRLPQGYGVQSAKATWMTALSTCLDKLGNLKMLCVDPYELLSGHVAWCGDALSLLSPSSRNLEQLDLLQACTFSRVPRWIGHLRSLRQLRIGVKQVLQEDVAVIGTRLQYLVVLNLRIPGVPVERIIIQGSTGFVALKRFCFDCDGMSFLTFGAGAMPALRELGLFLDAEHWDKAAPAGLQHLPSLEKIVASNGTCWYAGQRRRPPKATGDGKKADAALIKSVFQEAADALPTRPAVTHSLAPPSIFSIHCRPVEEEDYLED
ncbi:unnamed protein product [Urochloa humidicola]